MTIRSPQIPDLNIEIIDSKYNGDGYLVPDLNLNPNSLSIDSSNPFYADLNAPPRNEGDTQIEEGLQVGQELDFTLDENEVNRRALNEEQSQESHPNGKLKTLNNDERRAIYEFLLQKSADGRLNKGVTKLAASQFSTSIRTIQRIWKLSKNNNVSHRKTKNCGRKRVQIDFERLKEIPLQQRTTLRSLACALGANKATLGRRLKTGEIRRHSNAIKPFLKEDNQKARLKFCLSMLDGATIPHEPIFVGMYNIVYIDEKWFYMTRKSEKYYLLPSEEDPHRSCKSKNFIGKVMFLAAVAHPRFDAEGNEIFSGKIGIFPFVTQEPAKRTSVNRVAGTLETKPITSVKREIMRSYLLEKVVPTIKAKWPQEDSKSPIFIQQDNIARTHIDQNDEEFCRTASEDGFDIRLMCQPPNSPDLNILDLGFFNSIQSLQHKESPRTVDELISVVVKSFEDFPAMKSNHIFLTLQSCMIEIMKAKGANKYKIPHMSKAKLETRGQLPSQMRCDPSLVQEVLDYLN